MSANETININEVKETKWAMEESLRRMQAAADAGDSKLANIYLKAYLSAKAYLEKIS